MRKNVIVYILLCMLTGCASYSPSLAPTPTLEKMPESASLGGVVVGADPYIQPERQQAVFDGNLVEEGIMPIQIFVRNNGDRKILIRRSDIQLLLSDGKQLTAAGTFAVASKLEKTSHHFWATALFGIPGAFVAESASSKAKTERKEDYQSKEFKDITLDKNGTSYGFVYFIPPVGTVSLNKATLTLRCVDSENVSSFIVNLPISFDSNIK